MPIRSCFCAGPLPHENVSLVGNTHCDAYVPASSDESFPPLRLTYREPPSCTGVAHPDGFATRAHPVATTASASTATSASIPRDRFTPCPHSPRSRGFPTSAPDSPQGSLRGEGP